VSRSDALPTLESLGGVSTDRRLALPGSQIQFAAWPLSGRYARQQPIVIENLSRIAKEPLDKRVGEEAAVCRPRTERPLLRERQIDRFR
jgi:hypothetical protein